MAYNTEENYYDVADEFDEDKVEDEKASIKRKLEKTWAKMAGKLPEGSIAIALYDFKRRYAEELDIKQNEKLTVVAGNQGGKDFIRVKNATGNIGLVPKTYIELQQKYDEDKFIVFCEKYKIQTQTRIILKDNGLNHFEDLCEATEYDLKDIGINFGQRKAICRGIKDLIDNKQRAVPQKKESYYEEKELPEQDLEHIPSKLKFQMFCRENSIDNDTKDMLLKHDLGNVDVLADITATEYDRMKFTIGQRKQIEKALKKTIRKHEKSKQKVSPQVLPDKDKSANNDNSWYSEGSTSTKKNQELPEQDLEHSRSKLKFQMFCRENSIGNDIKDMLLKHDLGNVDVLADITATEYDQMKFTIGQRKQIEKALKKTISKHVKSKQRLSPQVLPDKDKSWYSEESTYTRENQVREFTEFDEFCQKNKIHHQTKLALKEHDVTELSVLSAVTKKELSEMGISMGQQIAIVCGIEALHAHTVIESQEYPVLQERKGKKTNKRQVSKENTRQKTAEEVKEFTEFDEFCQNYKIHDRTRYVLKEHDFTELSVLSTVTKSELDEMGISMGQQRAIMCGIETLHTETDSASSMYSSRSGINDAQEFKRTMEMTSVNDEQSERTMEMTLVNDEEPESEDEGDVSLYEAEEGTYEEIPQEHEAAPIPRQTMKTSNRSSDGGNVKTASKLHVKARTQLRDIVNMSTKKKGKLELITDAMSRYLPFGKKQKEPFPKTLRVIKGTLTDHNGLKIQKLPLVETYRDEENRIRKLKIGVDDDITMEKTILLVGATGSGKSTMIDGMINSIFGIEFNENFRLTLVDLEIDEKCKKTQTVSQTEWITAYKVPQNQFGSVDYSLTIVDMPGFGDTRGIERDRKLVEQLKNLFSKQDGNGIDSVDAVCFVAKANDGRLTPTQKYIFNSVLEIFGVNIKQNIQVLITHADGDTPAVLGALEAGEVPYTDHFCFNNSALYSNADKRVVSVFWDMGMESYDKFFNHLKKVTPQSLFLTAEVLRERQQLNTIVHNLQQNIQKAIIQISTNNKYEVKLKENKELIEANKNFVMVQEHEGVEKVKTKEGQFVTFCNKCKVQCHEDCSDMKEMVEGSECIAFTDGKCSVCPGHCGLNQHTQRDFLSKIKVIQIKTTLEDIKRMFLKASEEKTSIENLLKPVREEREQLEKNVQTMVDEVKKCLFRLNEIALKKGPPSETDYLELLIEEEKQNGQSGSKERVRILEDMKAKAELVDKVHKGQKFLEPQSTTV